MKEMKQLMQQFLEDIDRADLVLLGEKHGFLPHYQNAQIIQNQLLKRAQTEKKAYQLLLEHAPFRNDRSQEQIYADLQRNYSGDFHTFTSFFQPLLDELISCSHRMFATIGHHHDSLAENNRKMAKNINHFLSKKSITLVLIGQAHLGYMGSYYGALQSHISKEIQTLILLQMVDHGHPIVNQINRSHPNAPHYQLGISK